MKKGIAAVLVAASVFAPCCAFADTVEGGTPAQADMTEDQAETYCSVAEKAGTWTYGKSGKKKVKRAYRYEDGSYPTRICKIGKDVYYFKNTHGELGRSSKTARLVTLGNSKYLVGKDARLFKGWQVSGSLYFFGSTYRAAQTNTTVDGVRLSSSGKAVTSLNAAVKKSAIRTLDKITDRSAKKSKQLRDAWKYMTSSRFHYTIYNFNINSKTWAKRYALEMLTLHRGDCYGFAACFAALAHEIGYKDVSIVTCRVPGSRDRASDGYTRHGLNKINGYWYDTEADFAGWARGVYRKRSYPTGIKSKHTKQYSSYVGTGKPAGISPGWKAHTAMKVVKKGSFYQGYRGNKRLGKGLYFISGKLYEFNSSGRMGLSACKRLNAACKQKKPWEKLHSLVGKESKVTAAQSCYGDGVDKTYVFDHVKIYTFKPVDGSTEIVLSAASR